MSDNHDINLIPEHIIENAEKNEENIIIGENQNKKEDKDKKDLKNNSKESDGINVTVLKDDYPVYDLSFKIIIIGDSGNYLIYIKNSLLII